MSTRGKFTETESKLVATRLVELLSGRNTEWVLIEMGSLCAMIKKIFQKLDMVMAAPLSEYPKNNWAI